MAEEVVGSFPYEEWATEIRNALLGAGIEAEVSYAGPRAYPVLVEEEDSEKAGEILSQIGYFSCAIPGSPSLSGRGGMFSWWPDMPIREQEKLEEKVTRVVEDEVVMQAEYSAAMGWSAPGDDEESDVIIISHFGDAYATNGDVGESAIPDGYVHDEKSGGRVPSDEQEVDLSIVIDKVVLDPRLKKYPTEILEPIVKRVAYKLYGGRGYAYINVSGHVDYFRKPLSGK